jgi:hypothetical protein
VSAGLLARHASNDTICQSICATLSWLAVESDPPYVALHDAGVYAAVLPLLCVSGRSGRAERTALTEAVNLLGTAFCRSPPLRPRLRHLLLSQPGALAGVALAPPYVSDSAEVLRHLDILLALQQDEFLRPHADWWLLDTHFAAFAVLELRRLLRHPQAAMLVRLFIADWSTADSLHAHHLPHQALPAAVSLAMLAGSDARFRGLLAGGARLELLTNALLEVAAPDYEQAPQGCSGDWQLEVLLSAFECAAPLR